MQEKMHWLGMKYFLPRATKGHYEKEIHAFFLFSPLKLD